jgi:hypothetical protein
MAIMFGARSAILPQKHYLVAVSGVSKVVLTTFHPVQSAESGR